MHELDVEDAAAWSRRGHLLELPMGRVFVIDLPGDAGSTAPPALVLHGFPSCSFDWRAVLDDLGAGGRRVVLFDFVGFGLSDKPDRRYGIDLHADTTEAVAEALGLEEVALVTHDMGDSVGGEVLARAAEGRSRLAVERRIVTNGSIYLALAHLTEGQQLLLSLADERLPAGLMEADGGAAFQRGLGGVFSPDHPAGEDELTAQAALAMHDGGLALMPRLIRYLEDRRVSEARYTGAIEAHPSPLTVVWGEVDPVARAVMVDQLISRRPDATVVRLDGVGHYPMIEDPLRFGRALRAALEAPGAAS
jgi:pimeloyl-ACP methyl ester carboxylesterase